MSVPIRSWILITTLVAFGSCSSPTDPDDLAPVLTSLQVHVFGTPSGRMIRVSAALPDDGDLSESDSIPLSLIHAGVDTVAIGLTRAICGQDGARYVCGELLVTLVADSSALEAVRTFLAERDAAFMNDVFFDPYGWQTHVRFFSGSLSELRGALAERADVVDVELVSPGLGGPLPTIVVAKTLPTLPTLGGPQPVLPSALLTLAGGDTITAVFVQPNGAVLTAKSVVPGG